jgi:hypothetical protein
VNLSQVLIDCVLLFVAEPTSPETARTEARFGLVSCLEEPLLLLQYHAHLSKQELPIELAEQLWKGLVGGWTRLDEAVAKQKQARDIGYDQFAKWVVPMLEPEAVTQMFTNHVVGKAAATLTEKGWHCFEQFFFFANRSNGGLQPKVLDGGKALQWVRGMVTKVPNDLIGLDTLWDIALSRSEQGSQHAAWRHAAECLCRLHTHVCNELLGSLSTIRQEYVDRCMGHLRQSVGEFAGLCQAASSDSESNADLKSATKVAVEGRIVRLLYLLKHFVVAAESEDCRRRCRPVASTLFRGKPLRVNVTYTSNTRHNVVVVDVFTTDTQATLRREVMRNLKLINGWSIELTYASANNVRMVLSATDSRTLEQLLVIRGNIAEVYAVPQQIYQQGARQGTPENMPLDDELALPSSLLAMPERIAILFGACKLQSSAVRQEAYALLRDIPMDESVVQMFDKLASAKSTDEAKLLSPELRSFLTTDCAVRTRYCLEYLAGRTAGTAVMSAATNAFVFRKNLIESGVEQTVLGLLSEGGLRSSNLSDRADGATVRGCFTAGLHICGDLINPCERNFLTGPEQLDPNTNPNSTDSELRYEIVTYTHEDAVKVMTPTLLCWQRLAFCSAWAAAAGSVRLLADILSSPTRADLHKLASGKWDASAHDDGGMNAWPHNSELARQALTLFDQLNDQLWPMEDADIELVQAGFLDLIVRCPAKNVQTTALRCVQKLIERESDDARPLARRFRDSMLQALPHVESDNFSFCHVYFHVVVSLLKTTPLDHDAAVQMLEHVVVEVMAVGPSMTHRELQERQPLITGQLKLMCALLGGDKGPQAAETKYRVGSQQGLLSHLLDVFMFPACRHIAPVPAEPAVTTTVARAEDSSGPRKRRAEEASSHTQANGKAAVSCVNRSESEVCLAEGTRNAAQDVVVCLASGCHQNLDEIGKVLFKIHSRCSCAGGKGAAWDNDLSRRAETGYVGLKNLGATCYMNSIMQNLFMQPCIRDAVMSAPVEADPEGLEASAFYQVQKMWAHLCFSTLEYYDPLGFCKAFKDMDGQPIPLHEHQDGYEFFNRLVRFLAVCLQVLPPSA